MKLFNDLFNKKKLTSTSMDGFWSWFSSRSRTFFDVLKNNDDIEGRFINVLGPKLEELDPGLFFLAGMADANTAELVITADGRVKYFPLIEDLVNAAPPIEGWKFTALKQPSGNNEMGITMGGLEFDKHMFFHPNTDPARPDLIDLTVIHKGYNEANADLIGRGVGIFLDNHLGEYTFATTIDNISVAVAAPAGVDPIPMEKLRDYLIWRQKEFVEKYDGVRRDTENDRYSALEARTPKGAPIVAAVNSDLLRWDSKASHPWVMVVEMPYNGKHSNGMPDANTYQLLNAVEDRILRDLTDQDGFLNIGRETGDNNRTVLFACREFEKAARVMRTVQQEYTGKAEISFEIYKDKYWRSFERFVP